MTVLLLLFFLVHVLHARRLDNVYWNSSNTIFDISNTDHVIPVNIGDQISIVCPKPGRNYEYTELYLVSEESYTHCLLHPDSRLLGACNDPTQEASITVVFRTFSPIPGGLEFRPGRTYYVISTSDGTAEGIESRKGGLCESRPMRIKFEVELDKKKSERAYSPKFAARTVEKASESSTQQMLYIIHDDADSQESDVDATSTLFMGSSLLLVFLSCLLLL